MGACRRAAFWVLSVAFAAAAFAQAPPPGSAPAGPDPRLGAFVDQLPGFRDPGGVAYAPDGGLIVADTGARRVRILGPDGATTRDLDGGAAPFVAPADVAVCEDGLICVVDAAAARVRLLSPDGAPVAEWGAAGGGNGEFHDPQGIAANRTLVAIADTGNRRVQIFDRSGGWLRTLGGEAGAEGALDLPADVALDAEGRAWVVDRATARVLAYDAGGKFIRAWGDWGMPTGFFADPGGIEWRSGLIFVADTANHRVQVFDQGGRFQYAWGVHALRPREGNGKMHYPLRVAVSPDLRQAAVCETFEDRLQRFGLRSAAEAALELGPVGAETLGSHYGQRFDADGNLLAVVEPEGNVVRMYDLRGEIPILIHQLGTFGRAPGQFLQPGDVKLSAADRLLYVCDVRNRRIQVFAFDPPAEVKFVPDLTRLVRTIDLAALPRDGQDEPLDPIAIERDGEGRLYLLDARSSRVLVFDDKLNLVRSWGGPGAAPGQLNRPTDLSLSQDGRRLLVVDQLNERVQVFDRDGAFQFAFGRRGAASGEFEQPFSACCDASGAFFVSDSGQHRIQKFDKNGAWQASWGSPGVEAGQYFKPAGLDVDGRGRLMVLDWGNHRMQILSIGGEFEYAFGARLFVQPTRRRGRPDAPPAPAASQPAPVAPRLAHEARSNGGRYLVRYSTDPSQPPLNDYFTIRAVVCEADHPERPAPGVTLRVDAGMPEHQHGMNTQPIVRPGKDGVFNVEGMLFHMSGRWELYFDITAGGLTERAQVPILLD